MVRSSLRAAQPMMQIFRVQCSASSGNLDFQTNLLRLRRMRIRSRLGTKLAVMPLSEAYASAFFETSIGLLIFD